MTKCLSINGFSQTSAPQRLDAVVLLHGLFATKRSMLKAQAMLEAKGLFAINFGYRTCFRTLEAQVNQLMPLLFRLERDQDIRSINFLSHSFGGILMRFALAKEQFSKLKRAVMLAPPNGGTHLAKYSIGAFDRLFPVVKQLSEDPDSLPNQIETPKNLEIGIIAAESDFIVPIENTRLSQESEHCVMPTSHFDLPRHSQTLERSARFLAEGRFEEREVEVRRAA